MNEKKLYSVKELAGILGCSITAVNKKIFADENNPEIKRYRNRYEVVSEDGKTMILLSDDELENEKRLSKGFKNVQSNVNNNVYETSENVVDVEYTTETEQAKENAEDRLITFTKVFFERYETLQKKYFDDMLKLNQDTSKEIKLLTDSESEAKNNNVLITAENKQLQEKNKELQQANQNLKRYLILITILLLVITTFLILARNV